MVEMLIANLTSRIENHPQSHGINCICMDEYIREFRRALNKYPHEKVRIQYILAAASRVD